MAVGDGGEARLAPVIPLFGDQVTPASALPVAAASSEPVEHAPTREKTLPRLRAVHSDVDTGAGNEDEAEPEQIRVIGEESLVRKLRARSLSIAEARQMLRGHDLDRSQVDDVIEDFCRRGYLDDAILAEQLVISGIERKGQGRVALSRALAQRSIPRDVIDTALGDLPDDDAERALEFARTKARSMSRLDFDTALRRLMGQLARRGYGGSIASSAARKALSEASMGKPTSGVRFVDSD